MAFDVVLNKRLRAAMVRANWDSAALTRAVRANRSTIQRWISGRMNPPVEIVIWLEHIASLVYPCPAPKHWRRAYKSLEYMREDTPDVPSVDLAPAAPQSAAGR